MKGVIIVSLILFVFSSEFKKENEILILTDENFEEALKEYPILAIKFYAPWCHVSKTLEPEFIKAAQTLKQSNITCAQVDATQNKKAAKKASVVKYPQIKLYINDQFIDFTGNNTERTIVLFLEKEILPAVKQLLTVEEIEKFKEENKAVVMYFGNNAQDLVIVEKVAKANDKYIFGWCNNQALYERFKTSEGKIVLFKQFDELRNDYANDKIIEEDLKVFVSKHANPTLLTLDMATAKILFIEGNNALFFFRNTNDSNTEELDQIVTSISEKVRGKLYVVITSLDNVIATHLTEFLDINQSDLPLIFIQEVKANKHFRMKEDITKATLLQFVQDWENKKINPISKSEEIPTEQLEPVYKIVGNSFKDEVLKSEKNVLIKFYAPWCTHCQQLAPIYKKLAEKYKDDKTMLIAEIDATKNDIEGIIIDGYPTILFWKGDQKDKAPARYEGDKVLEELEKFIKDQLDPSTKTTEPKKEGKEVKDENKDREVIKEDL